MTIRTIRRLWYTLGALCIAGAAASIAFALIVPLDHLATKDVEATPSRMPNPEALNSQPAPQLADLLAVANRDWRRPIFDPSPPVPPTPTQTPPPPLSVKLLGTVVEVGRSRAIFSDAGGNTQFKGIGDTCAGAEVLAIEPGRVTVRYQDRNIDLALPKDQSAK